MRKKIPHTKLLLFVLLLLGWAGLGEAQAQEPTWHSFEDALVLADSTDRPILVDVWAPWCGWCRKMKQNVYPDLAPKLSDQFILTRLNRDDNEEMHQYKREKLTSLRLAQKLGAESVPAIVFLTSDGDFLLHLSGFIKAAELRPVLEYISTEAYHRQTFQDFIKQIDS